MVALMDASPTYSTRRTALQSKAVGWARGVIRQPGRLFLILSLPLWVLAGVTMMMLPDEYTSEWALILPGSGNGHAVTLESIGQASATTPSPYASNAVNPSVNYKAISMSMPVIDKAAQAMGMKKDEFGKPKIKLVDQTTILNFKIKGRTAKEAQRKAVAHYNALQATLDSLRNDELKTLHDVKITLLDEFGKKLSETQREKVNFQTSAGMLSIEQFERLIVRLETQTAKLAELNASVNALEDKVAIVQSALNIPDEVIRAVVNLRNDAVFQQYLKRHSEVHSQMSSLNGGWGDNHPKIQQLKAAHHSINHDIKRRGMKLADGQISQVETLVELGNTEFENPLLTQLIEHKAQLAALYSEVESTTANIEELKNILNTSATDVLALEDLSRKQQVATAVFSTALAKQDIAQEDRFSSYPLLQVLAAPELPDNKDNLKTVLVFVGAVFATCFLGLGCGLLWYQQRSRR